jgi:hypothetical protein
MPMLELRVEQSLLAVYPPFMIYTAQLNILPSDPSPQLKADFFTISGTKMELMGSAPFDQAWKVVLSKQVFPGTDTALGRVLIQGGETWSNAVTYTVR